jgi:GTP-binding protein
VIINKVDRPSSRCTEVENEIFDLFCNLDAPDESLEYPIYYASAKNGWAVDDIKDINKENKDMKCILDGIIQYIPYFLQFFFK